MPHETGGEIFDAPLGAKVTAEAKERLANLKAALKRRGCQATEQNVLDCLIKAADIDQLEELLPKKIKVQ